MTKNKAFYLNFITGRIDIKRKIQRTFLQLFFISILFKKIDKMSLFFIYFRSFEF
jgi:hypothetical protein